LATNTDIKRVPSLQEIRLMPRQPLFWIIATFLLTLFLFFVQPIFLNPQREMLFPQYVSIITPVADDFRYLMEFCTTWAVKHQSPYDGFRFYHPPLSLVFFTPLIFLKFSQAFFIMSVLTMLSFTGSALVLPTLQAKNRKLTPLTMLLFAVGLSSFGLQFELERGQFYSFTLFLCYLSIYIFHYFPRRRWLAYLLFSISIQIKFFPAIFVLMFVDDWQEWRIILRRFLGLGLLNFALLLALGPDFFFQFINVVLYQSREPFVWTNNHSITSFITLAASQAAWIKTNLLAGQIPLMGVYLACLGLTAYVVCKRRFENPSPYLMLVCSLGGLVLPAVSHDYSLPALACPVALFLSAAVDQNSNGWRRPATIIFTTLASLAYFSTLYSDAYKTLLSPLWRNNLPALLLLAICATVLVGLKEPDLDQTGGNND
jgi:hypothetical protein